MCVVGMCMCVVGYLCVCVDAAVCVLCIVCVLRGVWCICVYCLSINSLKTFLKAVF